MILEPPVRLRDAGPKEPIILSVGRFFAPGRGHAKKQDELVAAFSALQATGRADGWELHLVGGCDEADAEYLETVRRAAVGLPVVFHVDATGSELEALYARASIYWHAAGLGEDLDADPVRAEHFGISVVEAMSAGAVPIVYAEGGPVDVVRPDRGEGRWFSDLDQLVDITAELLGDPGARDEMGQAARRRARASSGASGSPADSATSSSVSSVVKSSSISEPSWTAAAPPGAIAFRRGRGDGPLGPVSTGTPAFGPPGVRR